jgi:glucosyl-3-phosphoglycerate phosphatase
MSASSRTDLKPFSESGSSRRIILWRHGQTSWNLARRFQGTSDIELTGTGVLQARRAARLLASLNPDAIVSSDLKRAAGTAAELAALTGLTVTHDENLRETYAGVWQGLTHDEIIERYGDEYAAWKRGEPIRRGGGELESEVADRAAPVVLAHADKLPEEGTLVVVSHGGTIRTTIGRLLEHNAGTLPEPVLGDDD